MNAAAFGCFQHPVGREILALADRAGEYNLHLSASRLQALIRGNAGFVKLGSSHRTCGIETLQHEIRIEDGKLARIKRELEERDWTTQL